MISDKEMEELRGEMLWAHAKYEVAIALVDKHNGRIQELVEKETDSDTKRKLAELVINR